MKVQLLDALAGTYEDNVTPLLGEPGDIIDISEAWAQRLHEAGIAVIVEEPEAPKRKTKVI